MHSHAALRKALPDFGAEPVRLAAEPPARSAPVVPTVPACEVEALVAERIAHAEAVLRAAMEADHLRIVEGMCEEHEAALADLTAQFGNDSLERITAGFVALETRLGQAIPAQVGRLLAPFLSAQQTGLATDTLTRAILDAMREPNGVRLSAQGSRVLWDALAPRLEAANIACEWREEPGFDLIVSAGERLWQTRLGDWFVGMDAALTEAPSGVAEGDEA